MPGTPKAITDAIAVLNAAPRLYFRSAGLFTLTSGAVKYQEDYIAIHIDDYARLVAALERADARTRIDPTKRAKRTSPKRTTRKAAR
jgi:hypothetical protein